MAMVHNINIMLGKIDVNIHISMLHRGMITGGLTIPWL
jgi:hypothetical protein